MSETVERLSRKLDEVESKVRLDEQRYVGDVQLSFLSAKDRDALDNRLKVLNLNYCRLAVDALVERIRVEGFTINGTHDESLWQTWRDLGMQEGSRQAVTDALMCGRGFVSVWGNDYGPTVRPEAPAQCLIERHPVTGEATAGIKRWVEDNHGFAVVYEPRKVTLYRSKAGVPEGGVIPSTGWTVVDSRPNPLGVIPLVQITNRGRTSDVHGVSEMWAIQDANDALTKVSVDALITSEDYARPKRWATGLAYHEDEETGKVEDPFADADKFLMGEEGVNFGQFPAVSLDSYGNLTNVLLNHISALSGLPAHYLFSGQQPSSGEEVRAKEVSLVARAQSKLVSFSLPFAQIASLMVCVRDGVRDPRRVRAEVVWGDPATRTLAQEADAIVKLATGDRPVLPMRAARLKLGYSPEQVADLERMENSEAAQRLAGDL